MYSPFIVPLFELNWPLPPFAHTIDVSSYGWKCIQYDLLCAAWVDRPTTPGFVRHDSICVLDWFALVCFVFVPLLMRAINKRIWHVSPTALVITLRSKSFMIGKIRRVKRLSAPLASNVCSASFRLFLRLKTQRDVVYWWEACSGLSTSRLPLYNDERRRYIYCRFGGGTCRPDNDHQPSPWSILRDRRWVS